MDLANTDFVFTGLQADQSFLFLFFLSHFFLFKSNPLNDIVHKLSEQMIYLCTVVVAVVFFLLLSIVITSVALYYRLLYYWIRLKIDLENKHFEEVELYHEPCAKSVKKVKQERKKRGLCYSKRNWEKEIIITLNVMMIFFLIYLKYKFYILKWKKNNYCSFS